MQSQNNRWVLGALLLAWAAPSLTAQERPPGPFSQMINVPSLVENYTHFLGRKYELTPEQEAATLQILQKRTDEFLAKHEERLFDLYQTMLAVRGGGDMSTDELMDWGRGAMPIYQDAKEIIIGGNAQWRELLTDEQRRLHDADVELMHESFLTTDEQLERIVTGEMTVDEFRNPPRGNRRRRRPNRPQPSQVQQLDVGQNQAVVQPDAGPVQPIDEGHIAEADKERLRDHRQRPGNPDITPNDSDQQAVAEAEGAANPEEMGRRGGNVDRNRRPVPQRPTRGAQAQNQQSEWEKYVEDFIRKYELGDAQQQTARRILSDCQEQAERYLATRKSTIDRIDAELASAGSSPEAAKQTGVLRQKREKLLEPIGRIFERQLKPRLDKLPTPTQRAAAEAPKAAGKNK